MNIETEAIIAKFLGWEWDFQADCWIDPVSSTYYIQPAFNSNWTAVMWIVEKIESTYSNHHGYFGVHISSNSCSIQGTNLHRAIQDLEGYGWVYNDEVVLDTKLESTYQACLRFILWYNQNFTKDEN